MYKTVEIECTYLEDIIGGTYDCEECILSECYFGSCDLQATCDNICGNMRFKRELKSDHKKLCEELEKLAERYENYIPSIAADIIKGMEVPND